MPEAEERDEEEEEPDGGKAGRDDDEAEDEDEAGGRDDGEAAALLGPPNGVSVNSFGLFPRCTRRCLYLVNHFRDLFPSSA